MLNLRSAAVPSDDDLIRWSLDNPGFRFEFVTGETLVTPAGGRSGLRNAKLHLELGAWAEAHGFQAFGSSTGFVFGDLKVSPDEALLRAGRFSALSEDDQEKLVPLAPDVAVEILPKSQQHGKEREGVHAKCDAMARPGVGYVVLLDPFAKTVHEWGTQPASFPDLTIVFDV